MKKFIALVLTLALAVSLCACSSKAGNQTVTFTVPMDDSTYTFTAPVDENGESATLPGGATIALATEQASLDDGADTLLWKGIQTFAGTYGYTAENHTAADTSVEAAEAALREAAESGAALVVCRGETMAQALFNIQNNYPGVHYLLFDGEPHNSSYTNYTTESNVHCVLFQEEQAGFLAGYRRDGRLHPAGLYRCRGDPRRGALRHRLFAGGRVCGRAAGPYGGSAHLVCRYLQRQR